MTTQAPEVAELAAKVAALEQELVDSLTLTIYLWPRMCAALHYNESGCECRKWVARAEARLVELGGIGVGGGGNAVADVDGDEVGGAEAGSDEVSGPS